MCLQGTHVGGGQQLHKGQVCERTDVLQVLLLERLQEDRLHATTEVGINVLFSGSN